MHLLRVFRFLVAFCPLTLQSCDPALSHCRFTFCRSLNTALGIVVPWCYAGRYRAGDELEEWERAEDMMDVFACAGALLLFSKLLQKSRFEMCFAPKHLQVLDAKHVLNPEYNN